MSTIKKDKEPKKTNKLKEKKGATNNKSDDNLKGNERKNVKSLEEEKNLLN
ncbi:hypothetical protein ACQUW5_15110 [Legionella sp. CNM-1927-20]|uniref:hypothetical protein n=1 Tax=Legionella sp. CNM-1927-20 TaxID=3422221 RepID=UPI00403AAAD7